MTPFKKRAILIIKTSGFAGFNVKIYEILIIITALNILVLMIPAVEGLVKK